MDTYDYLIKPIINQKSKDMAGNDHMAAMLAAALSSFTGMFFRGVKANYKPSADHRDKLYFATDTHELLVNNVSYGGGGISNVTYEDGTLKIEMTDGTEKTVKTGKYESAMDDSLATVEDLGGIPAGTTAEELKAKTISQILDDLLFPTVQPTKTDPTATLTLKSGFSNNGVYEVGASAPADPTNFTKGYTLGQILIAGVKKQDYAGAPTAQVLYYGSSESQTELPTEIAEGAMKYNYKVTFAAGPQPLDSKGGNATSVTKYAGGSKTATATINGVYPLFATTANIATLTKQALTNGTQLTFKAPSEGDGSAGRHAFKIPAKYTLTKVEKLNTLSNQYEDVGVSYFGTVTTANETVQGKAVSYKTYKANGILGGEATYRITFSK